MPPTPLSQLGESAVLLRMLRQVTAPAREDLLLGPGDDCAIARRDAQWDTLLKTDALVEGVHFTPDTPPRLIGRKALARAVSDIAAMGGLPELALVTIFIHPSRSIELAEGIYAGLSALAAEMEKAGNDGNIDLIMQKTDGMLEDYLKYKEILKPYFPECAEQDENKVPGKEDILGMLEQMQVALDNFDTLQIDEVIENMAAYNFSGANGEFFTKLKQAAEESDIEQCSSLIESWGQALMTMKEETTAPDVILQQLDKMKNALDEFDTLEIDDVVEEMSKNSYSDEQKEYFGKLKEAAENSDIDGCNEIVEKWRSAIAAMN